MNLYMNHILYDKLYDVSYVPYHINHIGELFG